MTTPPADPALLDEVVDLIRAAGRLTLDWFRSDDLVVDRKGDGTPVTEADHAAERYLRTEIAGRWPGDAVLGEEEGDAPGKTGRRWVIDPIDGTKAFTRGVPLYTNLLCLEDEYGPVVAAINVPALTETVYAGRGIGCFCDGRPARVSGQSVVADAYLSTSGYTHWPESMLAGARAAGCALRTWGDGYGYALVATGRIDAMVDPEAAVWDLAPMPLVIGEAGGRFTDLSGEDRVDGGSGIATNGILHDPFLHALTRS